MALSINHHSTQSTTRSMATQAPNATKRNLFFLMFMFGVLQRWPATFGLGREASAAAGCSLRDGRGLFDNAVGTAERLCRCPLYVGHGNEEHDAQNGREED